LVNFIVEKDLYNGAVGKVVQIFYDNKSVPWLKGAQPAYVLALLSGILAIPPMCQSPVPSNDVKRTAVQWWQSHFEFAGQSPSLQVSRNGSGRLLPVSGKRLQFLCYPHSKLLALTK
jgi:hypothetical protein